MATVRMSGTDREAVERVAAAARERLSGLPAEERRDAARRRLEELAALLSE